MRLRTLRTLALAITSLVAACNKRPTATDTEGPTVTATEPAAQEIGVPRSMTVAVTFSELIAPATVTPVTFIVADEGGETIVGTIVVDRDMVTFTPGDPLDFGTTYTARLTTLITDVSGNPLIAEFAWSFATVESPTVTRR